nr:HNH endonuclease [Hymenobacter defluvii]
MLEEPAAVYQRRVVPADELDTAVRSGLFKRVVLEAYDHTCAVSGLKLVSTRGAVAPLLDACHIVPWAISHNDTLPNGLALTPTLHRAFDRKLFWVDEEYRVQVAHDFGELNGGEHGIQQFAGRQLRLPPERAWWPGQENLRMQRG